MSILSILTEPNPLLHQKCKKVKVFDDILKQFTDNLVEIMFKNKGIGLAAPQLGKTIRLIAIEFNPERFEETTDKKIKTKDGKVKKNQQTIPLTIICNPKIISFSKEKNTLEEGCLSLPGIEIPIERTNRVKVLGQDLQGNRLKIKAKGLFARSLQHEIDHLDGILITDRVKNVKRKK